MKNILFIIIFLISIFSYSQTVNGIPITELDAKYVRINALGKFLKPFQVNIYLDYGQIARIKDLSKGRVLDDNGKNYSFNGVMGVVNIMVEAGYEIDEVYYSPDDKSMNYIMKKVK